MIDKLSTPAEMVLGGRYEFGFYAALLVGAWIPYALLVLAFWLVSRAM